MSLDYGNGLLSRHVSADQREDVLVIIRGMELERSRELIIRRSERGCIPLRLCEEALTG